MSAVFHQHIAHPCAWKAEELRRDPSWIYELKPAEVAEIETALKAVNKAGVPVLEMRARDFPLPVTAPAKPGAQIVHSDTVTLAAPVVEMPAGHDVQVAEFAAA